MPEIPYEKGAYNIFDRDYNDFSNRFKIEQRVNLCDTRKEEPEVQTNLLERRLSKNVLSDSTIE